MYCTFIKIECIVYLFEYLVDLGNNGEPMGLIYPNTFWNDSIIYDEYCYLLAIYIFFILEFLAPVAMHRHSTTTTYIVLAFMLQNKYYEINYVIYFYIKSIWRHKC